VELPGGFQELATYNIRIYVRKNLGGFSAEDYVLNLLALQSRQTRLDAEEIRERQIATTTVDGEIALRETVSSAPSSGPCIQVRTAHGDYLYQFEYCAVAHPSTHDKFIKVFDTMVAAFRFLPESKDNPLVSEILLKLKILKNMEYQLFECPTSSAGYADEFYYRYEKEICKVKLENGEYDFSEKITEGDHGYFVSFSDATSADLNNDKIDDALVVLRTFSGGTDSTAWLAAVIVDENGYRNADTLIVTGGGRGGIEITSINNGIIEMCASQWYEPITHIITISFSEENGFKIIKEEQVVSG